MRKIIAILICVLLVGALATAGLAAGNATMTVKASKTTANPGDEIVFTVSISEVDSLRSAGFSLKYDTNAFEMVEGSGKCTAANKQMDRFEYNANAGAYVAFFAFGEAQTYSGSIFQFTLKVKNDAKMTEFPVSINNLTAKDGAGSDLNCVAVRTNIKVTCKSHTWNDGEITKKASCSQKGETTYTCSVCKETKKESINKLDHTYDNACDTECNVCGEKRTVTHKWDAGTVTTKATCSAKGEMLHTCTVCKKTKTESIPKAEHTYDHDCDESCNVCGGTRTVEHDYMRRWSYDENGHWHACSNCGDVLEVIAHSWQAGGADSATGKVTYTCTECGVTKTENSSDDPTGTDGPTQPTAPTEDTENPSTGATEDTSKDPSQEPTEPSEGATAPTQKPEDDFPDLSNFPWWMIAAAVAVLAAFCGIFLLVGVLIGKKQQGKYSR